MYYSLEVDDVSKLFPNGRYAVRDADIVRKEIDEAASARHVEFRPLVQGPDINDDVSVYWVSYENEDLRVSKEMAKEELLDPDRRYKLFTVVGKAAKEPLAPITEEEGASEHRIEGTTVIRGDQVSDGALQGIDNHIWVVGREYLVFVRYELRPLPEQKGKPGPMLAPEVGATAEEGEFVNCFVRYVSITFRIR